MCLCPKVHTELPDKTSLSFKVNSSSEFCSILLYLTCDKLGAEVLLLMLNIQMEAFKF